MNRAISKGSRSGFTLVELLVVIVVLSIVTALIVPRMRIISKDRNIREAARVIGSSFVAARDRAIDQGIGGLAIVRNLNFVSQTGSGNRVYYAGTRLIELKAVPPYTGDVPDEKVESIMEDTMLGKVIVRINVPTEYVPANESSVVRVGDSIRLDNGITAYRISAILPVEPATMPGEPDLLPLVLDWDNDPADKVLNLRNVDFRSGAPAPPVGVMVSFVVERFPRRVVSSAIDLPAGYLIDLRYSGPLDNGLIEDANPGIGMDDVDTHTMFGLALSGNDDETLLANQETYVIFDRHGGIDQFIVHGVNQFVGSGIELFVTEYDIGLPSQAAPAAVASLNNPDNLWVTIGLNGGVNVANNAAPPAGTVPEMINSARAISRIRTSANQ